MTKFLIILIICLFFITIFGNEEAVDKIAAPKEERKAQVDKILGETKKDKRDVTTVGSRHFARYGSMLPNEKRMFKIFGY
uniref:Uncharacterized protein n=1 Tax=Panagrolaimus sp. ES5 TaxID=591445 RepID=A0AC34F4L5_9BILA